MVTGTTAVPAGSTGLPSRSDADQARPDRRTDPIPSPAIPGGSAPDGAAATAAAQAAADPPPAPGANGWTPANVVAVHSKNTDSFLRSALNVALRPVEEHPGQRLSTAMIDEIAPFMATTFQLDEQYVRDELAKVYVYVGGPTAESGSAMTVGHHIFVPGETALQHILSPGYKRWLVHELSHTMQFLKYTGGNNYTFLASYIKAMALGRDPMQPGSGSGPLVWGALFTGWRTTQDGHESIGKASATARQRLGFSLLPAALIGLPTGLAAAGAIAVTRNAMRNRVMPEAVRQLNFFGKGRSLTVGMALVAGPLLAGSLAGVFADELDKGPSQVLGAAAGAGIAGAALLRGGAFTRMGGKPLAFGMTTGNLLAIGGVAAAAFMGWIAATASANTIGGWSRSAELLAYHQERARHPSFADALHDSHWEEIDAEAVALKFMHSDHATIDSSPWKGVTPQTPGSTRDRLDWGLWNPLVIGVPAAAAAGIGAHALRTTLRFTGDIALRKVGVGDALSNAGMFAARNVKSSLGIGASLTLVPLMVGGIAGPIADSLGLHQNVAKFVGAGTASVASGVLLTMLLGGKGGGLLKITPKVLAGMAIAAGVGILSSSAAVNALHPHERTYDVSLGTHAVAAYASE